MAIKLIGSIPAGPDMVNLGVDDVTASWPLGIKFNDIYGNSYMYVLFEYAATIGDAVTIAPDLTENSGATGTWSMIQPTTATLNNFFGIAMNTVAAEDYGFVQVAGWNQVPLASTTLTAGKNHKCANASSALVDDTAAGSNSTYTFSGRTQVSVAAAVPAVNTVWINGMGSAMGL